MRLKLLELRVRTRKTTETVALSPSVTFFHGPVSTGKSTIARLIDYCLAGDLERTPAIRSEFVAAELLLQVGRYEVRLERGAADGSHIRVTWSDGETVGDSVSAPTVASDTPILGDDVFNFSDLIFKLAGVQPIKVRKSRLDPDSALVRLSIRDLLRYCYLRQDHLDSSFFGLEDPFKRLKSQDVMRFITGLHSERMSDLDQQYRRAVEDQRTKRESVKQIRIFMAQFKMGSEIELAGEIGEVRQQLDVSLRARRELESSQTISTHVVEPMREKLRALSTTIDGIKAALADLRTQRQQRESLRAELISAKVKSTRLESVGRVLAGAEFDRCPQCGTGLAERPTDPSRCLLCVSPLTHSLDQEPVHTEAMRRDLNERIDELADTIARQKREEARQQRVLERAAAEKRLLDTSLESELRRYDSAYTSNVRAVDREVAKLQERAASLERLRELPRAIEELEREAGELQGTIDVLKSELEGERARLRDADTRIEKIASVFIEIMRRIGFPGISIEDRVSLDPRNWQPFVQHGDQAWTFYDAGSGGKKTLFNVCYALAVHKVAAADDLPLPTFLMIDSPTKNISEDENPELVRSLYREIYDLAAQGGGRNLQFVLIDSDLVSPDNGIETFLHRRMAGETGAPCLISYYTGP